MFIKGQSGNPAGRKEGSQNKTSKEVKQIIKSILEQNLERLTEATDELTNMELIQFTKALLPYVMPKLQSIAIRDFDNSTGAFKTIDVVIHRSNENK
jgi:hypothetical protein